MLPLATRLSKSSLHCNTTSLTKITVYSIDITTKYPNTTTQARRSTHTFAITRQIPNSFRDALSAHHDASSSSPNDPISLTKCRTQHSNYQTVLQSLLPQPLLSLPPLEDDPDCPFVEDVLIVADGVACITNPGHASRRGREVDTVKTALLNDDRLKGHFVEGETLFDMRDNYDDPMATADGGDVLYTGRHFFVGLSDRTNERGWEVLRSVFGSRLARSRRDNDDDVVVAVPPVIRGKSVLHLKSAVTHLDPHTLLAPEGPLGDEVLKAMKAEERGYVAIRLKDVLTCNAVVVNGHVMVQDSGCEVSKERVARACAERGLGWTFVDTGELAKKDAALTCCSVLLEC